MQKAKLFLNGNSQAVRLPKAFRFIGEFVYIRRQGDEVILSSRPLTWDEFFEQPSAFGDDFLADRQDAVPQQRESF
jgi:antitoxin VapB